MGAARKLDAPTRLRRWRGKRTCVQAARALDCDPSYLSLLENRKRKPRKPWREVIQQIVGIPARLWDELPIQVATLKRPSPNVNDTRQKRPAKRQRESRISGVVQ
jgi:transcriptional regulator with XRE-family HTH domain